MKAAFGPGATFSNYRVDSLLGRGGMGVVYLARDESLERPVALKLIAPELLQDEGFRARFGPSPARGLARPPNVIPIYGAGEHEVALPRNALREGTDLRATLSAPEALARADDRDSLPGRGPLDAAGAASAAVTSTPPTCCSTRGHPYLTDFGITKEAGGESADTGQVVGTLATSPPSRSVSEEVDGRTDCYALACVL